MDKDTYLLPNRAEAAEFFARQSFPIKSCPLPHLISYSLHLLDSGTFDAVTDRYMTRKRACWIAMKAEELGLRDFNWQSFNALLEAVGEQPVFGDRRYTALFLYMLSSVATENKVFYIKFNKFSDLGLPASGFLRQTGLYKACNAFYLKARSPGSGITRKCYKNAKAALRKFMAAADSACVQDAGEQFALDYLDSIADRNARGEFASLLGRICALNGLHWIDHESGEPLAWMEFPKPDEDRRHFKKAGLPPAAPPRPDMLCSLLMDELAKYGESASSIGQYAKVCRRLCSFAARRGAGACDGGLLDAFASDCLDPGNPVSARQWKRKIALRTVLLLKELLARGTLKGFRFSRSRLRQCRPWLEELRASCRRHFEGLGLCESTCGMYDYVLRGAAEAAGAESKEDLEELDHRGACAIEEWFHARARASSLGTNTGCLRAVFKWLHAQGIVRRDLSGLFLKPYFVRDYVAPYLTLVSVNDNPT